ncbi:hypothetical protein B9N58_08500 [Finegoldia magna]|nr:hypothetical protein B9N58_08500 [Finegoldia magna]
MPIKTLLQLYLSVWILSSFFVDKYQLFEKNNLINSYQKYLMYYPKNDIINISKIFDMRR